MDKHKTANRYSLILETASGKKYYYDFEKRGLVEFLDEEKVPKASIQRIDFLTASFNNVDDFAKVNGINEEIRSKYILYKYEGKKYLQLCFNNPTWAHLALSYKGEKINFNDKTNLEAFNDVYCELINPDSKYATFILTNPKRTINIYPKTLETIEAIVRYEIIRKEKERTSGPYKSVDTERKVKAIYDQDKTGFYLDLRSKLTKYRDFRTLYLNYCKYIEYKNNLENEKNNAKKKMLIPDTQIRLFDPNDRGIYGK